jgi:hypothetical protein
MKRYSIADGSNLDGCLVAPSNYSGILKRLKKFVVIYQCNICLAR